MKSFILICAFSLALTTVAHAKRGRPDPWLNIVKSEDGYLFKGHLGRASFSFDIPGDQIQILQQQDAGEPPSMAIDDIFFSVLPIAKSEFPSTSSDILVSYRKSEQLYEKKQFRGAVASNLDVCKGTTLRHESWELQIRAAKAPAQVYAAFQVGDNVMLISSAFTNAKEKKALLDKFSVLCQSFKPRDGD